MEFSECCEFPPVLSEEKVSVLNMVASGHRGVGEGSVAKDCVRSCVCYVQLFVDYWPDCEAFQPHACTPTLLV